MVSDQTRCEFLNQRWEYHRCFPYQYSARRGHGQCCVRGRLRGYCHVHHPDCDYDHIAYLEARLDMVFVYGDYSFNLGDDAEDENGPAGIAQENEDGGPPPNGGPVPDGDAGEFVGEEAIVIDEPNLPDLGVVLPLHGNDLDLIPPFFGDLPVLLVLDDQPYPLAIDFSAIPRGGDLVSRTATTSCDKNQTEKGATCSTVSTELSLSIDSYLCDDGEVYLPISSSFGESPLPHSIAEFGSTSNVVCLFSGPSSTIGSGRESGGFTGDIEVVSSSTTTQVPQIIPDEDSPGQG